MRAGGYEEVTIVAIGLCTNLRMAVMRDPTIVSRVKRVIYMGGAINTEGNTTPAAEFNWWFDPAAAKVVVRAPWGKTAINEDTITQYIILPYNKDLNKTGFMDWWIDVNAEYGPDYGRNSGYAVQGPAGTQKVRIVNAVDENAFWDLVYAGLDARP
jgi:inosine-uridine nucleoside N-ribohydrolase